MPRTQPESARRAIAKAVPHDIPGSSIKARKACPAPQHHANNATGSDMPCLEHCAIAPAPAAA